MKNPVFNWVGTAVGNLASAFAQVAKAGMKWVSLTPAYVEHLLWLLDAKFKTLAQKGYGGNAAVYACMRLLSTSVPEPPLIAYQRHPDGQSGEPLAWAHPLRGLIRQPNPLMTEFDFWELTTIHMAIVGKCFWYKERNQLGQLLNLWPLRPDRVGPIYAQPDDPDQVLLGWSYLVPGTTRYLPLRRQDVMQFRLPDPMGESGGIVEGFGPLQALIAEVSADNEATNYVGSLVHNYATPGMVIEVQGKIQDQDTANLIKAQFQRDYGGARRGQPAIIDNGSKMSQLGFSLKDLEFRSLRDVSESRIAAAFGVPAILAGLLVGLDASSTNATVDQLRAYFTETTLSTYWRRYSDIYTSEVASEFGTDIVCLFDLSMVRALAAQAVQETQQLLLAYQNEALTKNEIREVLGYQKREDGDCYISGIGSGRGTGSPVEALPLDHDLDPNKAEPAGASHHDRPKTDNPAALTVAEEDNGPPPARLYVIAGGMRSPVRHARLEYDMAQQSKRKEAAIRAEAKTKPKQEAAEEIEAAASELADQINAKFKEKWEGKKPA